MKRARVLVLALLCAFFVVPATAGSASASDPASVVLTSDKSIYVAGQTGTFTSQITATNLDWTLSVQYPGESATTWHYVQVAANTNDTTIRTSLAMNYNMTVRSELTDPTNGNAVVASVTVDVPVRASIGTQAAGAQYVSHGYVVYRRGASPRFTSSTYPAFPGYRCLRHVVQRKYAAGWRNVRTSACLVEQKQGKVPWTWSGRHPSGVKFRVRGVFAGDAANRYNASAWTYFRFK
ncbi:MAG: hypothetical protein ACJ72D_24985 [Marmoricola sp.]